jgi:hypothetical protein
MSHINFNRYEVFTDNDMDLVFELQNHAIIAGNYEHCNYIAGLFDGYLYSDLMHIAETNKEFANLCARIIKSTL